VAAPYRGETILILFFPGVAFDKREGVVKQHFSVALL
jgi:hypothetical protein